MDAGQWGLNPFFSRVSCLVSPVSPPPRCPVADHADREHFIPLRVPDLVRLLCDDAGPAGDRPLSGSDQARFRRFTDTAAAHVHARYLDQLRRIKEAYAPFDPDADTRPLAPLSDDDRDGRLGDLFAEVVALLERANYVRLTRAELEAVMRGASDWGVDMDVAWDCFDRLEVFVRGKGFGKRVRKRLYGLRSPETVTLPTFQRVLVAIKQRPHPRLGADADTKGVFLKLFKDIPRMAVVIVRRVRRV